MFCLILICNLLFNNIYDITEFRATSSKSLWVLKISDNILWRNENINFKQLLWVIRLYMLGMLNHLINQQFLVYSYS